MELTPNDLKRQAAATVKENLTGATALLGSLASPDPVDMDSNAHMHNLAAGMRDIFTAFKRDIYSTRPYVCLFMEDYPFSSDDELDELASVDITLAGAAPKTPPLNMHDFATTYARYARTHPYRFNI